MPARFIGKTQLGVSAALFIDGAPVQRGFGRMVPLLAQHGASHLAEFFAEPVVTDVAAPVSGSVSWYTELPGDVVPLAKLPPERRGAAEHVLSENLQLLQGLLSVPVLGPWLAAVLLISSTEDILLVGERIVLTGWGIVPAEAQAEPPASLLPRSPLGRYIVPAAQAAAAVPPLSLPLPDPAPIAVAHRARPLAAFRPIWSWWLVPAAACLAIAFLIGGLWLGRLIFEHRIVGGGTVALIDPAQAQAALDAQNAENETLEKEIEQQRLALKGNLCKPAPAAQTSLAPDHDATPPPAAVTAPQGGTQFLGNITQLLQQSVVAILVPEEHSTESGSGFLISPDTVVTNYHVVEHVGPRGIFITSRSLGHVIAAHVAAHSDRAEPGIADYAVLHLDAPLQVQPLSLTRTVAQLDPVIAAGYPGLTLSTDVEWQKLLHGDLTAAPELILTDGRISAIQNSAGGIKIMPHSAAVSPGNSGGPLVDACGRVVGVNTFINVDQESAAHTNYAQKADDLIAFLAAHGVVATVVEGPCGAVAAAGSGR